MSKILDALREFEEEDGSPVARCCSGGERVVEEMDYDGPTGALIWSYKAKACGACRAILGVTPYGRPYCIRFAKIVEVLERAASHCPVLVTGADMGDWCDWQGSSAFSDESGTCKRDRHECGPVDCWLVADLAATEEES